MAGMRRRRKSADGFTRTSTNKGWTTSSSYGAGKKNGLGYRVTTTRKADGKTVIRTTERGGQGWFKTTQKTISSKDPFKITKRDLNKLSNSGSSLLGDLFDMVEDIVDIFKNKDVSHSQPTTTPVSHNSRSVEDTIKYKYKLQYTTDKKQWYYCQSDWDSMDCLAKAKERLQFKQQGTTVNKYRIMRIDESGYAEPIPD